MVHADLLRAFAVALSASLAASALAQNAVPTALATVSGADTAIVAPAASVSVRPMTDPIALEREGVDRYHKNIRDYRCVLVKQERIEGTLRPIEEIEVRYRESPKSVYMIWRQNPDQARRALFIDAPEFVDDKGRKTARVEPNGALVRLVISDIMMPIHGERATKASRRTIDEFGFLSTWEIFERYNDVARRNGVLDLQYAGEGQVDGRPTHVLVRRLPYNGPNSGYPERRLVLHVDKEWMVPTAVFAYADDAGKELLGSYQFTQVQINPGLTDADFRF